jgi:hypothetical protein
MDFKYIACEGDSPRTGWGSVLGSYEYSSGPAGSVNGGLRESASQKRLSSWTYRKGASMICDNG